MTGTYTLPDKLREYAERAVNLDELRPLMVKAADEIECLQAKINKANYLLTQGAPTLALEELQ